MLKETRGAPGSAPEGALCEGSTGPGRAPSGALSGAPPVSLSTLLSSPVRDTPPYRAISFRDSTAEGGIARICLVLIGYRASIAEIPLLRGGIAPPLRMFSKGETLRKGGRGIAPNWPC